MKQKRREFIKFTGLAGLGMAAGTHAFASGENKIQNIAGPMGNDLTASGNQHLSGQEATSLIGAYGAWAASLISKDLPSLSKLHDADTLCWSRMRFLLRAVA